MTQQAPAQELTPIQQLLKELVPRIRLSLGPEGKPEEVLSWLADKPKTLIRETIQETQPKGWKVASQPLLDSLSDDQCVGVLVAIMAVYVQTM